MGGFLLGMLFMFGVKLLNAGPEEEAPLLQQHRGCGRDRFGSPAGPAKCDGSPPPVHMITLYGSHLSTGLFAQDAAELQALVLQLDGLLNEPEATVEVCASGPPPPPSTSLRTH